MINVLEYAGLEQGSDLWHELRTGKFSASEWHRLMGEAKRDMTEGELKLWKEHNPKSTAKTCIDPMLLSTGAMTYCMEVASERITKMPAKEFYENDAMRWGKLYESPAKKLFSLVYDVEGINVGFVKHTDGSGCSPDWIVIDKFGAEVKCPITRDTHLKYFMLQNAMELKEKYPDHYWQCAMGMKSTGYKMWKFISYHPHYPPSMQLKVINVPRIEEDMELMGYKLEAAESFVEPILLLNK